MSEIPETLITIAENQEKVFEAGKNTEYNNFWDTYQQKTSRYQFAGSAWNNDTFKPKYDIRGNDMASMFMYSGIQGSLKDILSAHNVILDTSNTTSGNSMFQYAEKITEIPCIDLRSVTNFPIPTIFYGTRALITIEKLIIDERTEFNTNAFQNATALKNIIIEGVIAYDITFQWSNSLSHDSLISIINALKDYSSDISGTIHTIGLSSSSLQKLSEEEKQIITKKGWTY